VALSVFVSVMQPPSQVILPWLLQDGKGYEPHLSTCNPLSSLSSFSPFPLTKIVCLEYLLKAKCHVWQVICFKWNDLDTSRMFHRTELVNIILSEGSQVQKDKDHVFSHMWKIDPIQI
jgi:hypothetical protein